jgi:ppGpp synthetase/RelA/SpoT-type nucleotidyltranferase
MCVIPSKGSLNRLGTALLQLGEDEQADEMAYTQLNHYRSLFHPLMTMVNTQCRARIARILKSKAKDTIVVQRIKRLESIVLKLQKNPEMDLARMQDIGGVRVILPDIESLNIFTENLFHRSKVMTVKDKNTKDYILHPKPDGYRGVHYLLELKNNRLDVAPFEKLVVELQVRTLLQHCWATGVEIAGIINNKQYKTGDWDADWGSFFLLLSQHFASIENQVNTNIDEAQLNKLKEIIERLNVIERLEIVSTSFKALEAQLKKLPKEGFVLLVTDFEMKQTTLGIYTKYQEAEALAGLIVWESRFRLKKYGKMTGQALLIKTTGVKNLKKAYPNYYMDTQMLIDELQKLIKAIQ